MRKDIRKYVTKRFVDGVCQYCRANDRVHAVVGSRYLCSHCIKQVHSEVQQSYRNEEVGDEEMQTLFKMVVEDNIGGEVTLEFGDVKNSPTNSCIHTIEKAFSARLNPQENTVIVKTADAGLQQFTGENLRIIGMTI